MPEYSLLARLFFWFSFIQSGKLGFLGENFVVSGFLWWQFPLQEVPGFPKEMKRYKFWYFLDSMLSNSGGG